MAGGSPSAGSRPQKSRRLSRLPSDQDHGSDLHARRGFATLDELFSWPDQAWQALENDDANRPRRLAALAEAGGLQFFSYMSGKGTEGTCIKFLCRCMRKRGLLPDAGGDPFVMVHASDHMQWCVDVLVGMKDGPQKVYQHVFGKGQNRLSDEVRQTMQKMASFVDWKDERQRSEWVDSLRQYLDASLKAGTLMQPDGKDYCHQCLKRCPVHPRIKKYTIVVSGTSCEDYTLRGTGHRMTGVHMEEIEALIVELKLLNADAIFLENSDKGTLELHEYINKRLGMKLITGLLDPREQGVPAKRPRRYSFLWNEGVFRCSADFDEYLAIFCRSMVLTGQSLLTSSHEERQQYLQHLANAHKEHFSPTRVLTTADVLSVEETERVRQHMEKHYPYECAQDGSYFTTIEQSLSYASTGAEVPSLTKNAKVMSLRADGQHVIATPKDHLVFMGEALVDDLAQDDYPCYFKEALEQLTPRQIKYLAGNAMQMTSIGHFMMYCLTSLTIIPSDERWGPSAGSTS